MSLEDEIRDQGDRTSQIVYGLYDLSGQITAKEVASIVGVSRNRMYEIGRRHLRFKKGLRPEKINKKVKYEKAKV